MKKTDTTIIGYSATEEQDQHIERLTKHEGNWFNPEEDYYVMEDPSEKTLLILALLGIEIEWIKGGKPWHDYVREITERYKNGGK